MSKVIIRGFFLGILIALVYLIRKNVIDHFYSQTYKYQDVFAILFFSSIHITSIKTKFFSKTRRNLLKDSNAENKMSLYLHLIYEAFRNLMCLTPIIVDFSFEFWDWAFSCIVTIIISITYYQTQKDPEGESKKDFWNKSWLTGLSIGILVSMLYLLCASVTNQFYPQINYSSYIIIGVFLSVADILIVKTNIFPKVIYFFKLPYINNNNSISLNLIYGTVITFFILIFSNFGISSKFWNIFCSIIFIAIFTYIYYRAHTDPVDGNLDMEIIDKK